MRLIDADALYDAFERTPWMDNADRDIAEEVAENAPTVAEDNNVPIKQPDPITALRGWVKTADREEAAREIDKAASYTIPQMASNNVVINITGGSEQLAHTQTDAQHAKNLMSGALDGTDAADRLRWLLSQAERAGVLLDKHDHEAVTLACDALEGRIDVAPGFDSDRSGQRQEDPQMTKDEAIAYFERQVRLCDYLAEHIAERHIPEGHNYSVEAFLADTMRDKEAYTIALEAIRKND